MRNSANNYGRGIYLASITACTVLALLAATELPARSRCRSRGKEENLRLGGYFFNNELRSDLEHASCRGSEIG